MSRVNSPDQRKAEAPCDGGDGVGYMSFLVKINTNSAVKSYFYKGCHVNPLDMNELFI